MSTLTNYLTAIANAIRTVKRGSATINAANFASQILTLNDSTDATASADKILSGYTAYAGGSKIVGTISSQGSQTITPGTSNKTITSGKYLSGTQTILGDADLIATNIKSGVDIFGVTGTYEGDIRRLITNDDSIIPTGTYATSVYYDTTYGVKIGYMANGDIILSTRGGTTTGYEHHYYTLVAPAGVTLDSTSGTLTAGWTANTYACVIKGLTVPATISIDMGAVSSTYDRVTLTITVTAN